MNLSKSRLENLALVAIVPFIVVALHAVSNKGVQDTPKQCKVYHASAAYDLRCEAFAQK